MDKTIKPLRQFNGDLFAPPDKSITHRAILFSAFSEGKIKIHNALLGEDCLASIDCARKLGAEIVVEDKSVIVKGTQKIKSAQLYVGNSGTTMRLLAGMLAGQSGKNFTLDGDASIKKRPMNRVIEPLTLMGAKLNSASQTGAVLCIKGENLHGISYKSPVASAQVKSAILLAGLNADGKTVVTEPVKSRDHTERMLRAFGARVVVNGLSVAVESAQLKPCDIAVVGDISSAAYALILAAGLKAGRVTVRNVGTNPTRDGLLRILTQCGASYRFVNQRAEYEPFADIELEYARLKPFHIEKELVPSLVDEIPILAVLAAFIEGESTISGAEELKVKESNRIDTIVANLKKMGADIEARPDGMVIHGKGYLSGGTEIDPNGDHRIAMSMAVAGALSKNGACIKNAECADVSYPGFYELLEN